MELQQHSILYHVHDPMCSWCWGFRKVWDQLRAALPEPVTVVNVVGGLAPDTDQSMPQGQQKTIAGYWHDVTKRPRRQRTRGQQILSRVLISMLILCLAVGMGVDQVRWW